MDEPPPTLTVSKWLISRVHTQYPGHPSKWGRAQQRDIEEGMKLSWPWPPLQVRPDRSEFLSLVLEATWKAGSDHPLPEQVDL